MTEQLSKQKNIQEISIVHLRSFKNNKTESIHIRRKGRLTSFCLHHPIPQTGILQC